MRETDIESVRITRRETNWTGANLGTKAEWHPDARPFSEVFIVAAGRSYYTRRFHTLDDSPHARAAQVQDFLRRQNRTANEH